MILRNEVRSMKEKETDQITQIPGILKERDTGCRILSYRVRDYNADFYLVESYTMQYRDEWNSYVHKDPDYPIHYHTYFKEKQQFHTYIRNKSRKHRYDYSDPEDSDQLNFYLATHYFLRKPPAKEDETLRMQLTRINTLARDYMTAHNASVLNAVFTDHTDNQLIADADALLRSEITRIECINVGQANFSMGYHGDSNHPLVVFDIGIRSQKSLRAYPENKLRQIDGNGIVIISHYDADHINGVRYLDPAAKNRIWFLPQKRLSPTSVERNLLTFLEHSRCAFLPDIDYRVTPFNPAVHVCRLGNLRIYQGNAAKVDSCQSTSENARSLICTVKKDRTILLPGDSLYEEFPTDFGSIDYLVVPHHSCDYDKPVQNLRAPDLKELVVFAGPHRGYRHPNFTHLRQLARPGSRVIYLLNHDNYCFDGPTEISHPYITITVTSHNIYL